MAPENGSPTKRAGAAPLVVCAAGAALLAQAVALATLPVVFVNDSSAYLEQTHGMAAPEVRGAAAAQEAPSDRDILYPPGYPLFLDLCRLPAGRGGWMLTTVLAQHVLSFLSVLLVASIGAAAGRPRTGAVAALLYALYLPRVIYAQAILSETLFTFLLLAAIRFFPSARVSGSRRTAAALGAALGAALLVKPVAGILLVVLAAALALDPGTPRGRRSALLCLAAAAGLAAGALAHNAAVYGKWRLTTCVGRHLADRVFRLDRLVDRGDPATREVLERLESSGRPYKFPHFWWNYWHALRKDGSSIERDDALLLRAAWAGIASDPAAYARNTLKGLRLVVRSPWQEIVPGRFFLDREAYANYLTYGYRPPPDQSYLWPGIYTGHRAAVRALDLYPPPLLLGKFGSWWFRFFGAKEWRWRGRAGAGLLVAGCLAGLVLAGGNGLRTAVAGAGATLVAVTLLEYPFPRYFEPFMPLALVLWTAGAAAAYERVRSLGRSSRSSAGSPSVGGNRRLP